MPSEVLAFTVKGLGFHCFRRPVIATGGYTYPVPPITTVYGMLNAMMDAPVDDYTMLGRLAITVRPLNKPSIVTDYARLRRAGGSAQITAAGGKRTWIASPTRKQNLLRPEYECYVTGPRDDLDGILLALEDPAVSPGLGRPDDSCVIKNQRIVGAEAVESDHTDTMTTLPCTPGCRAETSAMPIGYRFDGKWRTIYAVCHMPKPGDAIKLATPSECLAIGDIVVTTIAGAGT